MLKHLLTLTLLLTLCGGLVQAKNVDLSTLPDRQTVQLTIYNSEDLTLVKETRFLSLKKGMNKLQFSWANTLIDPTSVELRPLDHVDDVEVLDTVFPGQKPQHLIWNIESKFEGQVKVEVTYFTSGISWAMDYVGICDPDETKMLYRGYVRVINNSGEEYENAEIRMIVGTVNLVEKIAELAQADIDKPGVNDLGYATADRKEKLRKKAVRKVMEEAQKESDDMVISGRAIDKEEFDAAPKEIVKEGLSEYFMFSVPGTETVMNGWSKRMIAVDSTDVTFEVVYRMRAHQYGPRPVKFFTWKNDDKHKLGDSPLPDGLIRIFRDNGKDGLSYLGELNSRYVSIKGDIEINLGTDDLVVIESRLTSVRRINFSFEPINRQIGIDKEFVNGWDEEIRMTDIVKNFKNKPIKFELQRIWEGDVDYTPALATTLFDFRTTETKFEVKAGEKKEVVHSILRRLGQNQKQNAIVLKQAAQ